MSSETITESLLVDGRRIEPIVEPANVSELCDVIKEMNASGHHTLIAGGGTRLAFGNRGGPFDLAISTRRLNRILHYEPDDLTLAVEPGCTIAALTEVLARHGQMIALDAAHAERSTIGGAYAAGMSGPRRLGGGSLKDWAIGIEVLGADGQIAKAGGMVVKNVTGYDMMHLHHGALGAFGVVTRLNLKVFPAPGAARAIVLSYDTSAHAYAAGLALLQSQLQPSGVIVANEGGWTVRARCDAPPSAIDRQALRFIQAASTAAEPIGAIDSAHAHLAVDPFVAVTDLIGHAGVARLSVPASRQLGVVSRLSSELDMRICADLGSGLVYAATPNPDLAWVGLIQSVSDRPVFLALPSELKRGLDMFGGIDEPSAVIVRRLKASFDPKGRFNRGRFVLNV